MSVPLLVLSPFYLKDLRIFRTYVLFVCHSNYYYNKLSSSRKGKKSGRNSMVLSCCRGEGFHEKYPSQIGFIGGCVCARGLVLAWQVVQVQ
jgi:hypothetical protein